MLTLEIIQKKIEEEGEFGNKIIIINGHVDYSSNYLDDGNERILYLIDQFIFNEVLNNNYELVKKHFDYISYTDEVNWWDSFIDVGISFDEDTELEYIEAILRVDTEEWSNPWSVRELAEQLKLQITKINQDHMSYSLPEETPVNGFGLKFNLQGNEENLKLQYDLLIETLREGIESSIKVILEKVNRNSILTYFNFPQEIRPACKQYLIYFSQFMYDLGIDTDTEISDEASKVLFKITPKDKDQALDTIRTALELYLKLPNNENVNQLAQFNDIAVRQLEANIFFLNSQLTLAKATIQSKDATIEALQLSNYLLKQTIDISDSPSKEKEAAIVKGIITVSKFKWNGLNIDLAELFNRLKRKK